MAIRAPDGANKKEGGDKVSSIVIGKGSWYQAASPGRKKEAKRMEREQPFLTHTLTRPIGSCDQC